MSIFQRTADTKKKKIKSISISWWSAATWIKTYNSSADLLQETRSCCRWRISSDERWRTDGRSAVGQSTETGECRSRRGRQHRHAGTGVGHSPTLQMEKQFNGNSIYSYWNIQLPNVQMVGWDWPTRVFYRSQYSNAFGWVKNLRTSR